MAYIICGVPRGLSTNTGRCTSLANGARGRRHYSSTRAVLNTGGVSGKILLALKPHVDPAGQELLSILQKSVLEKRNHFQREAELLEEQRALLEEQRALLEEQKKQRALLAELLVKERESSTHLRLQLLQARGLNNTRGLFEHIQEVLAGQSMVTSRLRGPALWEQILKGDASLAACILKCTKVPVLNVAKQAHQCYNLYSVLSDHVHSGKSLAELQIGGGGTILFERGPLTSEQVQVFKCIGAAANAEIQENPAS